MPYHKYHIKHKHIAAPCGRDCPDRCPGCGAMCASWQLYSSVRDYIYNASLRERQALRLTDKSDRLVTRACNERPARFRDQKWR